jgi:membrane-associated phospholipid phosphatase
MAQIILVSSGHTAIAFTNATLLFQEYKDSNLWYASSGFVFATATAILRIANNKHYSSDVLAEQELDYSGILVTITILSRQSNLAEK